MTTETKILLTVAFVLAVLVFLGCLAALAVIARKDVHKVREADPTRSPEWERLNAALDASPIDDVEYRAAFDAWAKSVGLNTDGGVR